MAYELRLRLDTREPFAPGTTFGEAGAYERWVGRAEITLDPESPHYAEVVDLEHAPRDERGRVRYETDVYILKPVDMARGNRRLLYDVVNRGDKRALQFFNDAPPGNAPSTEAHAGNGFLMRQGYTVVWCGWQADVVAGEDRATLDVPIARDAEKAITGTVREELMVDEPGVVTLPMSGKSVTRTHPAASLDTALATFTRRAHEGDAREPIPANEWQYARLGASGEPEPSPTDLYYPAGFEPGWIYEVTYTATEPQVLGLGFAAVRDLVDFLRHQEKDADGRPNPLADAHGRPLIERAYAWGRSQSGRYLREFVYRGWNVGMAQVPVFDALWPHVTGGGRLALNVRFGHPDRFPRQHEHHLYPSDQFPFAYVPTSDPWSSRSDALLHRPPTDPFVFHTQTSSEYWQRRGSLVHTDGLGEDLADHPKVRLYLFASSQHHAAPGVGPEDGPHQHRSNPLNTSPLLRALLVRLDEWVSQGIAPPPSAVPRRRDGTLVSAREAGERFPRIGSIRVPAELNRLFAQDFGPEYERGIGAVEPPLEDPEREYAVRVPATDDDGNEIPGLRTPDVEVPLATYTGWNPRPEGMGAPAMYSIVGSYLPLAQSRAQREDNHDARASLEERYPTQASYVRQVVLAADALHRAGLLLEEDVERYVSAAISAEIGVRSGTRRSRRSRRGAG